MAVSFFSLIFMTFVILIACGVDYIRKYSHVDPFVFEFKNPTTSITRITDTRIIRLDRDKDAVNFFNDSLVRLSTNCRYRCSPVNRDVSPLLKIRKREISTQVSLMVSHSIESLNSRCSSGRLQRLRISYNLYFNIDAVITDVLRVNNTDGSRAGVWERKETEMSFQSII